MRRTIRSKRFAATISIKYIHANGSKAVWEVGQQDLTDMIVAVVDLYAAQSLKLTARQLFYQLVSKEWIPNAHAVYKRLCDFLKDLRYAGIVDWDAVEDRGRIPQRPGEWDNIKDIIDSALEAYRLPRWSDQDYYVELYCEKMAMEGILLPTAQKYHVYFGSNKGYSSASAMFETAKRFDKQIYAGKMGVLLYLGDHDPSGLDMVRDIQDRVCEFLGLEAEDNDYFNVEQIALNQEQIKKYKPPHNAARIKDPRAGWYSKQFGKKSWELDALEPKVLVDIAERGILKYLDTDKYNAWVKRETLEKKKLKAFGKSLD